MRIIYRFLDFLGGIKPEKLFLSLALTCGAISLILVPVFTVPDEGAHLWTSYSIFSETIPEDLAISPQEILKKLNNKTYFEDIFLKKVDFKYDRLTVAPKTLTTFKANEKDSKPVHVKGSPMDLAHIPQAIGLFIGRYVYGSVGSVMLLGRLINMAVFILIIYFVIKYTRKWKLVIMCIALFPMIIQQIASLSYDVFNYAIIIAWVVLVLNIAYKYIKVTNKVLLISVVLSVLILLTKPINFVLLLLLPIILFIKLQESPGSKTYQKLLEVNKFVRNNKKFIIICTAIAVVMLFSGVILLKHSLVMSNVKLVINTFLRPEINTQLDPIVLTGIVGNFGWLWYRLPAWLVFINLLALCIVLLKDNVKTLKNNKYLFYIFTGMFLAYLTGMFLAMYLLWTRLTFVGGVNAIYIQGVQGRYITPILILLVPAFGLLSSYIDIKLTYNRTQALLAIITTLTLSTYLFLTYIFYYTTANGIRDVIIKL